jgi:hypothetical protein
VPPTLRQHLETSCIFDAVDCITDLQRQVVARTNPTNPRHWLAREEAAKLRHYEPGIYSHFRQVVVTSRHDAKALTSLGVRVPISVIPNGVKPRHRAIGIWER